MAVCPQQWQNQPSAGQFRIPNMRGRSLIGQGTTFMDRSFPFLEEAGYHDVALTAQQMPAHTHGESAVVPAIINGGLEAPAAAATPVTGTTLSAGGGQTHENMPPYLAVKCYVVGRLFP